MQDPIINPSDPMSCHRPLHEKRLKPQADQALKCPRCDSLNTKFCYFNNYSLTQPRHFCKNCKRYWTKGGALRNVPIGGGCRKNKRSKQRLAEQATSPAPAEEALLSSFRGDGSSSSSSLQQDFSGTTSSPGGLYASNDGDGAFTLTFERLEQASRSYGLSNAPISINWAAGQVPTPPTLNLQPYDSNMLALNLTGHHLKQEPNQLQNGHGDLSSLYEPHLNLAAQPSTSLTENVVPYNLCLDSFVHSQGNGELQWRLPPKLVTMTEEDNGNGRPPIQCNEDSGSESFRFAKGKLLDFIVPRELDEPAASLVWPPAASDGFFDATVDSGYWNNVNLSSDLAMYGIAGSQLL